MRVVLKHVMVVWMQGRLGQVQGKTVQQSKHGPAFQLNLIKVCDERRGRIRKRMQTQS